MSSAADNSDPRYSRQTLFAPIGARGQKRLRLSKVTLVGCGALGSALANTLVRAGVGTLRIIDRDFIETNNLQRQALFDEHDVASGLPKAEAAARKLRRINSGVEVEGVVADVNSSNVADLCGDTDLLLDGTDNLETRYLVNDLAVRDGLPWVYGACISAEGRILAILPGKTPCLRCLFPTPPAPGELETCDTAGVIGPIVDIVAAWQATEAIKIMIGKEDELIGTLLAVDAWRGKLHALKAERQADCPCCAERNFEFLDRPHAGSAHLCGRDAIQLPSPGTGKVDFKAIQARLPADAHPVANPFLLRFQIDQRTVTLFADGRAIIQGVHDPAVARSIYARYIGA